MAEERSLSSGMPIPQWMKSRMHDRLNFDENTFSPPEVDTTFFHLKLRNVQNTNNQTTESGTGQSIKPKILHTVVSDKPPTATDFSKHTEQCKQFIEKINYRSLDTSKDGKVKSNGTDDGFKGEGAACGSSVIRVAHQMVNSKISSHKQTIREEEEEYATEPTNFNRSLRRGSKSLPSSPLGSPKSNRRMPNKYFGAPAMDLEKYQGSWILSGLLKKGSLSQSVNVINEEEPMRESLTKSVSQMSVDEDVSKAKTKRSKAAELREMNFYSPTSM